MDMIGKSKIGFIYTFQCFDIEGRLKWEFEEANLIPDEGRDYMMNAALNGGAQFSTWYVGLYSGNYTPVATDTAATFVASATEITTAYSETTRVALVDGALAAGLWANVASPASFTFTAASTVVRGGFITSVAAKSATTGVLLSAVLAGTAKTVLAGEVLKVTTGLSLVTA